MKRNRALAPSGAWAALLLAAFVMPVSSSRGMGDALDKVVELLKVLSGKIAKDEKDDTKLHQQHTAFLNKEIRKAQDIIADNQNKILRYDAELKENEAFRAGKKKDLVDTANKLGRNEMELSSGREGRQKERKVFEKNEAAFVTSLAQLSLALTTLRRRVGGSAASAANLLEVAKKLETTLLQGSDFTLSTAQRETLRTFLQTAHDKDRQEHSNGKSEALILSFLQESANVNKTVANKTHGPFKSGKRGIIGTIEGLQKQVKKEKAAGLAGEQQARRDHKTWEDALVAMIENGKKSIEDMKTAIAESQQLSSLRESAMTQAKEILKTETVHLSQLQAELKTKGEEFKSRSQHRADESVAVKEALKVLKTEIKKAFLQRIDDGVSSQAASFIQVSLEHKHVERTAGSTSASRAISFLEVKAVNEHKSDANADPFKSVKNMIKEMLERLQTKQAQEKKHGAWCDEEMAKTATEKRRTEAKVQRVTDRVAAILADLAETQGKVKEITKDLKDMKQSAAEAARIREAEHKEAVGQIASYKDSAKVLNKGLKILKEFYEKKGKDSAKASGKAAKQRSDLGAGVIGILEISIDDFQKLHDETAAAEESAATEFQKMQDESKVRIAVFEKDLELRSRNKVKLEFDASTLKKDLKNFEAEMSAIKTYEAKLEASCILKGPTYDERVAQRQAKLNSLEEAMQVLQGQAR